MASDSVEAVVMLEERIKQAEGKIRAGMAKPGKLGLPALLEARRLEYIIPDGAFEHQAAYDRILVMQLPEKAHESGRYEGTKIIMTQEARARNKEGAPRGVICSAGLAALDNLRSNGMDLGHIISFVRQSVWRVPVGIVESVPIYLVVLRDGDIIASEDLPNMLRKGKGKIETRKFGETEQHVYVDATGKQWNPTKPWMGDDY
jgi:hypothetical protein